MLFRHGCQRVVCVALRITSGFVYDFIATVRVHTINHSLPKLDKATRERGLWVCLMFVWFKNFILLEKFWLFREFLQFASILIRVVAIVSKKVTWRKTKCQRCIMFLKTRRNIYFCPGAKCLIFFHWNVYLILNSGYRIWERKRFWSGLLKHSDKIERQHLLTDVRKIPIFLVDLDWAD